MEEMRNGAERERNERDDVRGKEGVCSMGGVGLEREN
jgi:hypothetical protein